MTDAFDEGLRQPKSSKYMPVVTPRGSRIHLWLPPTDLARDMLLQMKGFEGMTLCGTQSTLLAAIRFADPTEPKCRTCSKVLRGSQK